MESIKARSYMLVTGGAGGIGSAICRLLPTVGITPIVGYRTNVSQADTIANELNSFAVKIDMSENYSITLATQIILEKIKFPNSLIGVVLGASPPPELEPFNLITDDHLLYQFRVNVIGSQLLLKGLIKGFFQKKKTGTVIGILTKAIGNDKSPPATGMAAYIVAKAALNSLLSVCEAEYPWLKVRTVTPSFTKTPMLDVFDARYLELLQASNKISTPEEVARLVIEKIIS